MFLGTNFTFPADWLEAEIKLMSMLSDLFLCISDKKTSGKQDLIKLANTLDVRKFVLIMAHQQVLIYDQPCQKYKRQK